MSKRTLALWILTALILLLAIWSYDKEEIMRMIFTALLFAVISISSMINDETQESKRREEEYQARVISLRNK